MNIRFYPKLILRTPALPLNRKNEFDPKNVENADLLNAIRLASPDLTDALEKDLSGTEAASLASSLIKYHNRMSFRCTPFGLFAGCGITQWTNKSEVLLNQKKNIRARLDKEYLSKIVDALLLEPIFFKTLKLYINNTIYDLGDHIRFIETTDKKLYQVTMLPKQSVLKFFFKPYSNVSRPY